MQAAHTNGHRNYSAVVIHTPSTPVHRLRVRPGMVCLYTIGVALLLVYILSDNPLASLGAFLLFVVDAIAIWAFRKPYNPMHAIRSEGVGLRP